MWRISQWSVIAVILLIALPLAAQQGISAKAGLVNYFEGTVFLNGEELEYSITKFHQIPPQGILETPSNGRAEVLLSPGVMLWLAEGSRLELVSDKLDAAEVRLLQGNIVVSSTEFPDDTSVTLLVNDDTVTISKAGVYDLAYQPAELAVHQGQAEVLRAGVETRVKKGRSLLIDQPNSSLARIDKNATPDGLMLWAQSRDNYIQVANLTAARTAMAGGGRQSLGTLSMLGAYQSFGGWMFNPYFGMYTFVPFGQGFSSPFGGYYWGPRSIGNFYAPYFYGGGGGFSGGGNVRALNSRNSVSRSGFSNNAAYGSGSYARGSSSMGRGSSGGFDSSMGGMPSRGAMGSGGFSRGASAGGGSVGGGGRGVSAPSSGGGASMGRGGGGATTRGGGGGRGN